MADVTDRWMRIQALFEAALDRPDDERSAWLRAACGGDPDLYPEVDALLAGDAQRHALFDGRAADLLSPAALEAVLAPSRLAERAGPDYPITRPLDARDDPSGLSAPACG